MSACARCGQPAHTWWTCTGFPVLAVNSNRVHLWPNHTIRPDPITRTANPAPAPTVLTTPLTRETTSEQ